jgi:hypothetical protein
MCCACTRVTETSPTSVVAFTHVLSQIWMTLTYPMALSCGAMGVEPAEIKLR